MDEKLVSIITPCYNGEDYIVRFFNNILEQTYTNIELIFINDGSVDNTEQIALDFKHKFETQKHSFVYIYQDNAGQAAAVNKGLKIFTGEYLIWTDSDDILDKNNVKHKVEFMEKNLSYGFAQCYGKEVLESDLLTKVRDFRRIPPIGEDKFFEDLIIKKNVEYTPGLFIARTSAFLASNPNRDIDESRIGQNLQMLLPLAYQFQCGYLKEDLFSYVIRDDSHSHDQITTEVFINRSLEYKKLLLETLNRINMNDREYYIDKVEETVIRNQFNAGYAFKDTALLKKKYNELKATKYLTKRDTFVYYAYKFKVIKLAFIALKKLKAAVIHIIHN